MNISRPISVFVLAIVVAARLTAAPPLWAQDGVTVPVLSRVVGEVKIRAHGDGSWTDAEDSMVLESGDTVWTGPGSRAEISHASGTIRLFENTLITVPSIFSEGRGKEVREVDMDRGTGLFRLHRKKFLGRFEVRTRHLIAGVKGTTFGVTTDEKSTRVAVYRGQVEVTDREGSESSRTEVGKGRAVTVQDGRGFGTVEKFKRDNDWKGWDRGRRPHLKPHQGTKAPVGNVTVAPATIDPVKTDDVNTREISNEVTSTGGGLDSLETSIEESSGRNGGSNADGSTGNTK